MLTNDSYFIGNLYHLIIYSSECAYNYEVGLLQLNEEIFSTLRDLVTDSKKITLEQCL